MFIICRFYLWSNIFCCLSLKVINLIGFQPKLVNKEDDNCCPLCPSVLDWLFSSWAKSWAVETCHNLTVGNTIRCEQNRAAPRLCLALMRGVQTGTSIADRRRWSRLRLTTHWHTCSHPCNREWGHLTSPQVWEAPPILLQASDTAMVFSDEMWGILVSRPVWWPVQETPTSLMGCGAGQKVEQDDFPGKVPPHQAAHGHQIMQLALINTSIMLYIMITYFRCSIDEWLCF